MIRLRRFPRDHSVITQIVDEIRQLNSLTFKGGSSRQSAVPFNPHPSRVLGEGAFCRRYTQTRQTTVGVVYADGKMLPSRHMLPGEVFVGSTLTVAAWVRHTLANVRHQPSNIRNSRTVDKVQLSELLFLLNMKIYNLTGYLIIFSYMLACMYFAPAHLGPWTGILIGAVYFIFCWFLGGLYLADVLHLGIAHRSLDYKEWFIKIVTVVNNVFGLYVDPIAWVNRHRLHHKHSDHPGDPNKVSGDGFWRTFYLCVMPYRCNDNLAGDEILRSRTFRIVANPVFAILAQASSFYLFWKLVGDLKFVLAMWIGIRIFAQWVNMVQNYWTHTRTFGYRRYDDEDDNAMNIGEWLPVTATFSACFQNNHHHYPGLLRLSHDKSEYDFGFLTVKVMKYFGLVKASRTGAEVPKDVPLGALEF